MGGGRGPRLGAARGCRLSRQRQPQPPCRRSAQQHIRRSADARRPAVSPNRAAPAGRGGRARGRRISAPATPPFSARYDRTGRAASLRCRPVGAPNGATPAHRRRRAPTTRSAPLPTRRHCGPPCWCALRARGDAARALAKVSPSPPLRFFGFFPGSFFGNSDVRPERSRGVEAGLRWRNESLRFA